MTFLPIVERELRVRARLRSTYRFRLLAAISAIVLVGLLLLGTNQLAGSGGYGAGVFRMLSWLSFAYCLLEGARHTADCLSAEKREGTLGLLFLTDLRPYDLVLGKLMATSLNSIYGLLAIFPPLAIPLVIGGVTAGEFWRLVLVLMNTVFFSLTAGLVVSAASRDERRAWTGTAAIVLLFAVVPPLLLLNAGWSNSSLAALSPTTAFLSTFDSAYAVAPDRYWQAIWSVHLLTWTFLGMATFVLPRAWQDRPVVGRVSWWRRLAGAAGTEGKVPDLARRSRILAGNPVVWLVVRSGSEQIFLWTLVGFASVAAFTGWLLTRGAVGMALTIAGVLLLVHLALAVWVASEACHLLAAQGEGSGRRPSPRFAPAGLRSGGHVARGGRDAAGRASVGHGIAGNGGVEVFGHRGTGRVVSHHHGPGFDGGGTLRTLARRGEPQAGQGTDQDGALRLSPAGRARCHLAVGWDC